MINFVMKIPLTVFILIMSIIFIGLLIYTVRNRHNNSGMIFLCITFCIANVDCILIRCLNEFAPNHQITNIVTVLLLPLFVVMIVSVYYVGWKRWHKGELSEEQKAVGKISIIGVGLLFFIFIIIFLSVKLGIWK